MNGGIIIVGRSFGFPLACLDRVLFHRQRSWYIVEFVVKSARVANGIAVVVASPQRGGSSGTVGALEAHSSRVGLPGGGRGG